VSTLYHAPPGSVVGNAGAAIESDSTTSSERGDLSRNVTESNHGFKLAAAMVLPDMRICRARAAGFGDYADCLVDGPFACRHALGFGKGVLCLHPERKEIVIRTSAIGLESLPAHLVTRHELPRRIIVETRSPLTALPAPLVLVSREAREQAAG
jgi:hypothetical protein